MAMLSQPYSVSSKCFHADGWKHRPKTLKYTLDISSLQHHICLHQFKDAVMKHAQNKEYPSPKT